jgi:hypothetical protein
MKNTTCKNCGGDEAIHHYETNQCPVGGCEAPIGRKQEWKSTMFEAEDNKFEKLCNTVDKLVAQIEDLARAEKKESLMPELKEKVQNFIHKYLDVSAEAEAAIADYALKTWQPLPNDVPYLRFLGDHATGKTRAGAVMAAICKNAVKVSGYSPDALMVTMDEKGIVPIFDDVYFDVYFHRVIRAILINGSTRNQKIVKMMERNGKLVPVCFDIFGYKVILSRTSFREVSLEARCFTVNMTRTDRNDIPYVLNEDFEKDSAEIQQALSAFYVGESANAPDKAGSSARRKNMRYIKICLQETVTDEQVGWLITWLEGVRCVGAVFEVNEILPTPVASDGTIAPHVCETCRHGQCQDMCASCNPPRA